MLGKKPFSGRAGILLVNIGTPEAPTEEAVREYLAQFLMDPYVIDIPYFLRWFFVHGIILKRRPAASAQAYQKIWMTTGSPLLHYSLGLKEKVQEKFKGQSDTETRECRVEIAMRYGEPCIKNKIMEMKEGGIEHLIVFPLYPQYSLAATESTLQECLKYDPLFKKISIVPPFFDHPLFIRAFADVAREHLGDSHYDHFLFSFHGLPERQIRKLAGAQGHCFDRTDCCEMLAALPGPGGILSKCYRAQCFVTAKLIADQLGLSRESYTVCFQSRLGRQPWIRPYTDLIYEELPQRGVKRIAVFCPSFVADCLETLEEVAIRGRASFLESGGEDLRWIPSLNVSEGWANCVTNLVSQLLA